MSVEDHSPEDLCSRLLYRDALMLVIDKPAGIAVHKGPKGGPSLEDFFDQLRFGLPRPPALAHRLDRDTSGCLVLGRHRKALERLGLMFKQGKISKTYWAIVQGAPENDAGLIDLPLGRLDATRGWWMKVDPLGVSARTVWRVLGRSSDDQGNPVSWLELRPLTGRTHQLRVHCEAIGCPIIGDVVYGAAVSGGPHDLQLHAQSITVPIQKNKGPIRVEAPAPQRMIALLTACGWSRQAPADEPDLSQR